MGFMDKISGMMGKGGSKNGGNVTIDKTVLFEKIRQSDLFKDLPAENLEEMFSHMETVVFKAGQDIIKEGDEGDYYYLIISGSAKVTRRLHGDPKPQIVAELVEPTGFGEEALISNAKRNASVTMSTNGTVMRLSKDAFDDYVKEPMVNWLAPADAQKKIAEGAKWVDVRDAEKAKESHLHGALSIPMEQLRDKMTELKKETLYVCYCENGRLSSTAAFLLRQHGFNVSVLRGGIQSLKSAGLA